MPRPGHRRRSQNGTLRIAPPSDDIVKRSRVSGASRPRTSSDGPDRVQARDARPWRRRNGKPAQTPPGLSETPHGSPGATVGASGRVRPGPKTPPRTAHLCALSPTRRSNRVPPRSPENPKPPGPSETSQRSPNATVGASGRVRPNRKPAQIARFPVLPLRRGPDHRGAAIPASARSDRSRDGPISWRPGGLSI